MTGLQLSYNSRPTGPAKTLRKHGIVRPGVDHAQKHIIGYTGQGKSRLLQSMFVQLLHQSIGVSLIDPHRDLARDTLRYLIQQGSSTGRRGKAKIRQR